jgi:hypothetical protein
MTTTMTMLMKNMALTALNASARSRLKSELMLHKGRGEIDVMER